MSQNTQASWIWISTMCSMLGFQLMPLELALFYTWLVGEFSTFQGLCDALDPAPVSIFWSWGNLICSCEQLSAKDSSCTLWAPRKSSLFSGTCEVGSSWTFCSTWFLTHCTMWKNSPQAEFKDNHGLTLPVPPLLEMAVLTACLSKLPH